MEGCVKQSWFHKHSMEQTSEHTSWPWGQSLQVKRASKAQDLGGLLELLVAHMERECQDSKSKCWTACSSCCLQGFLCFIASFWHTPHSALVKDGILVWIVVWSYIPFSFLAVAFDCFINPTCCAAQGVRSLLQCPESSL